MAVGHQSQAETDGHTPQKKKPVFLPSFSLVTSFLNEKLLNLLCLKKHSRINSTNSPALGSGKAREPRLMSQVGRVHEVVFALISAFLS